MGKLPAALCIAAIFAVMIGFGVRTYSMPPPNAHVALVSQHRFYVSPPCLEIEAAADFADVTEAGEVLLVEQRWAKAEGYKPDPICAEAGGFISSAPLIASLLGADNPGGALSRWHKDGSWRH